MTMKQILAGAALLLLTTSALAQGAPKAPTVGGKRLVHVKPIAQPDVNSSERSKAPSCGLVIAWRTNCAVAQLAMNPLQQRAPFLLRKVRKSKRSGDYSSHQSIAIFPPKNSTALDLMPTIYLLRERSGIDHSHPHRCAAARLTSLIAQKRVIGGVRLG
jgi:hypothetical protein